MTKKTMHTGDVEKELLDLTEKLQNENKALRKILMNIEQSKVQSQTESSESEKDLTLQSPKKGKSKRERDNQ